MASANLDWFRWKTWIQTVGLDKAVMEAMLDYLDYQKLLGRS